MSAPHDQPPNFPGRYVVERELGRGASAVVYLARDTAHDRPVAIKVLHAVLVESLSAARFLREVRQTARLIHPRILPVLDAGEAKDGRLYFVTPYMDGGTLRERLTRERQLPVRDAVAIAHAVATALEYAHGQGLLHRDVKPENILFAGGEAYLGDFGIARALDPAAEGGGGTTTTGMVRGTPVYMSPEQASGERELDGRSDVYALGCVLFEMLAGVLPFVGATPQSVVAQRFVHAPEPVTRYRPSVPAGLAGVLAGALAMTPADRYTARELGEALAGPGLAEPTGGGVIEDRWSSGRKREWLGGRGRLVAAGVVLATAFAALAGAWALTRDGRVAPWTGPALDTTRVLVLPVEVTGARDPDARTRYTELLADAVDRWDSVSVVDPFQRRKLLGTDTARTLSDLDAVDAARRALVGRYVQATVAADGDSVRIEGSLYDAYTGAQLHHRAERAAAAGAGTAVARLADSLLLRGARITPRKASGGADRSTTALPAALAMARALTALDEWDLAAADSALTDAIRYDPGDTRAAYWLAQARAWQDARPGRWVTLAGRAVGDGGRLSPDERERAAALAALGRGDFDTACAAYDRMRRSRPDEYVGWFGYAQCHELDRLVVPDRRSPSGWRFRRSYEQAIQGYRNALLLLPNSHRSFQRGAYGVLRLKFFTSPTVVRPGYALAKRPGGTDTVLFYAKPGLVADTLAFFPYPKATVSLASPQATPATLASAVARGRAMFREIAMSWASAAPGNAGIAEAVAMALDASGDPSAPDTLRRARGLTGDPAQRDRLLANEILLRVKYGLPDHLAEVAEARRLGDSALTAVPRSAEHAAGLLSVAALLGRCDVIPRLARAAAPGTPVHDLPAQLVGDARSLEVTRAIGCPTAPSAPRFEDVWRAIPRAALAVGAGYTLLGRAVAAHFPVDSQQIVSVLGKESDYLLEAELAAVRGDPARARRLLLTVAQDRAGRASAPSFDAAAAEAQVWMLLGDTASATRTLTTALESLRDVSLAALADPTNAGSLLQCVVSYARIPHDRVSAPERSPWSAAARALRRP